MPRLPTAETRLTRAEIHTLMRTKLGGTRFEVELDVQQINAAIDESIRKFRRATFGTRTVAQPEVVGVKRFTLPTNCFAITRYDYLSTDRPAFADTDMNVFELSRARVYGFYGDRPGALLWLMQQVEMSRRVRGTEPTYWHVTQDGVNDIVCYVPTGPRDVCYDCALTIQDVTDISFVHEDLFLTGVEGQCRLMLSDMRGKYGGSLPGSTGDLQLDAATQLQRGNELMAELKEGLRVLSLAMPPITG